jgi:hypothetical protein
LALKVDVLDKVMGGTVEVRMLFDTQYTVQELDGELLDLLRVADIN